MFLNKNVNEPGPPSSWDCFPVPVCVARASEIEKQAE